MTASEYLAQNPFEMPSDISQLGYYVLINSYFIGAAFYTASSELPNDDDLDEENIPGFTHPGLAPLSPNPVDKGKARAPENWHLLLDPGARACPRT
ncbi:uncharacterized protein TRAVEDRAFT_48698 [Trametes versicolor FP-101664 SS1]|uniref:uncharacterized protein n=1 Tax=Trametes versicolor (strain FP-101664) TaxID=717944 RepID=UPI000462394E|nr:uncharacterized protein TRAVEDRAFT_48698 [Trametes versicolor FP-101664 SS1]EIW57667.1 hypothetical protein TRAVEDRAFT_48698 [Trametes versicolor FP-101664 SS1]